MSCSEGLAASGDLELAFYVDWDQHRNLVVSPLLETCRLLDPRVTAVIRKCKHVMLHIVAAWCFFEPLFRVAFSAILRLKVNEVPTFCLALWRLRDRSLQANTASKPMTKHGKWNEMQMEHTSTYRTIHHQWPAASGVPQKGHWVRLSASRAVERPQLPPVLWGAEPLLHCFLCEFQMRNRLFYTSYAISILTIYVYTLKFYYFHWLSSTGWIHVQPGLEGFPFQEFGLSTAVCFHHL